MRMRGLAILAVALVTAGGAAAEGPGYRLASIRVDGTARQTLIRNEAVRVLDFSPDRRWIVFTKPAFALYIGRPDGRRARRIIDLRGATVEDAVWSPDGTRVALSVTGKLPTDSATCGLSVWTLTVATAALRKVSDCAALEVSSAMRPAPWSADGHQLAFVSHLQPPARTTGVLTVSSADGVQQHAIGKPAQIRDLAWSPRRDWIAYDARSQLRLVRLSDGSQYPIEGRGAQPAWAPNGRQLAFVISSAYEGRPGNLALLAVHAVPAKASVRVKATVAGLPTWSPNASQLAYTGWRCSSRRRCSDPQIYVLQVHKRTAPQQVTNENDFGKIVFERLWWGVGSRRLIFARSRTGV